MQIVYHIGANCTDEERLLKSLLKNAQSFTDQGIKVPGPGKYRRLIRETIQNLDGAAPAPDTREILLDAILDDEQANRVVMSHDRFICFPHRVFEEGRFYGLAEQKVTGLSDLFPQDDLELFIGIRNPATFVPAVFRDCDNRNDFVQFLGGIALDDIRWSSLIARIRAAVPRASVTVWCNEDTPLIWAQLLREMSGVDPLTPIKGGFDLIQSIMTDEGMSRFLAYIKGHPPKSELQKRRIISAFLDKFAKDDEVEEEYDLPGWTEEVMDRLTELYDDDVHEIARMPGVNFIAP